MKKIMLLLSLLSAFIVNAQKSASTGNGMQSGHPSWIMQGNIYEVNVRQYTPEGTFKAFARHLERLKAMGVQTLWFMPLNPISKVDRKGTLGSYYAVSDYTSVNPEFGTMEEWKELVQIIHQKGMKVIIDWVPNHTGGDNRWLNEHPDFFEKDSSGKAAIAKDWADTRQLDYKNHVMQDSMIGAMKYWLRGSDIDGFRCDVAWNVPGSFWKRCIGELKKIKNVFMLAEGDNGYLPKNGFDAVYPWRMFHKMQRVSAGELPALALDTILKENDTLYPANTIQMYFTSNHDENSWNKADFGIFPGPSHAPFAVYTQTMFRSVPLIYSGQEEPMLRPISFFEKDTMHFENLARVRFYRTLLMLRKRNQALSADATFRKVNVGDEKSLYAYVRQKGSQRIFVILNFSTSEQTITINDNSLLGNPFNVFSESNETLTQKSWKMKPWGYVVYEYVGH